LERWLANIKVRTQVSAFLAGTFFAVLLVFATQEDKQALFLKSDVHAVLTKVSLTMTFIAFAFSTFAYSLSSDFFRKGADQNAESLGFDQRAKTTLYVGLDFFGIGYLCMMLSLAFVLAYAHLLLGIFGLFAFVLAWVYLYIRTGPYVEKKE